MKILTLKKTCYCTIFLCLFSSYISAQESLTVEQDPKFEQLLNEKIKANPSIFVNDHYKIQIYNGDSETAKKTLSDFKKEFKNYDATIIFSTPTYKVWVGNIDTRINAEKMLMDLSKRYPKAILIKPNK